MKRFAYWLSIIILPLCVILAGAMVIGCDGDDPAEDEQVDNGGGDGTGGNGDTGGDSTMVTVYYCQNGQLRTTQISQATYDESPSSYSLVELECWTAAQRDAKLSGLTVTDDRIMNGTVTPTFVGTTYTYSYDMGTMTASPATIWITPTQANPGGTIKINGTTVASGGTLSFGGIPPDGSTVKYTIVSTAADGTSKKTYVLNVTNNSMT